MTRHRARGIRCVASAGSLLILLASTPGSVAGAGACTSEAGTIAHVLAQRPTIVVARPIANRFDGAAYDLMVEAVVVGPARVGRWSFGPTNDPRPFKGCRRPVVIPDGQRVLLVIWRPGTGNYPGQAWWEMPDTRQFPPYLFTDQAATTLPDLIAEIRATLPDTSTTEALRTGTPLPLIFGPGLVAFLAFLVMPIRRRIESGARPRPVTRVSSDATLVAR